MSTPIAAVTYQCKECHVEVEVETLLTDITQIKPIEDWACSEGKKQLLIKKVCPFCDPLHILTPSRN